MTRRLLLAVLIAVAAVMGSGLTTDTARAEETPAHLERVGWWWSLQTGFYGIELPPPADVEEGGILIHTDFTGTSAIGAIRWILPTEATDITLTLTAATPGTAAASTIVACPAVAFWLPAHGGWWSQRAQPDCDRGSVPGELSEDGVSWSWSLDELAQGRVVDVVLLPDSAVPFRVTFGPPEASALTFTPIPPEEAPVTESPSTAPDETPAEAPPAGAEPQSPAPPTPGPFVTVPAPAPPLLPTAPEPAQVAPPATAPEVSPTTAAAPAAPTATTVTNPLAFVLLGALGATALGLLGPGRGLPAEGGLGRFARPRDTTPSPLR